MLNQLEYMDGAAYAETVRESYRSTGKYLSDKPSWEEDQKIGSFANDPYTLESLKMAYDENVGIMILQRSVQEVNGGKLYNAQVWLQTIS